MYYRLKDRYRLVGWRDVPTGVLDLSVNSLKFLPRDEYGLLLHMNGREDLTELSAEQREMISRFCGQGLVESGSEPFPDTGAPLYTYYDNVRIESVQWSITGRCNYSCRHCFVSAPGYHAEDLPTGKCLDIIRQMAGCGIRKVSFTGGEPLVRPDLPELFRACTDSGISVTGLYTNGALLTRELIDSLIAAGQRPSIQVSYDGAGWHDWVRGRAGAQETAEKALRVAHDAGLETSAAMCLFRDNIPAIRETVRALASLSVSGIKISPMLQLGLWEKNHAEKTLSHSEFLDALLEYIPSFIEDGKPCSITMGGYLSYYRDRDFFTSKLAKAPSAPAPLYPCPWIASNLYISPEGNVLPCMEFAGHPEYTGYSNLLRTPLSEILQDSEHLRFVRTRLKDICGRSSECMQCPERGIHCGQSCRACAGADFCGTDPGACLFVRNGWYDRVRDAVEKAGGRYEFL